MTTCTKCMSENSKGYCAPLRCYCNHSECNSTYQASHSTNATRVNAKSWQQREESTWIDKL